MCIYFFFFFLFCTLIVGNIFGFVNHVTVSLFFLIPINKYIVVMY